MNNNYLFIGTGNVRTCFDNEFVDSIISRCHVDDVFCVGFDDSVSVNNGWHFLPVIDCLQGNYPETNYKTVVDGLFENPISDYTAQIIYMMNRNGKLSTDERIEQLYNHISFWQGFLYSNSIKCVLFSTPPHEIFDFIILKLAHHMRIATVFELLDGYDNWGHILWTVSSYEGAIRELKDDVERVFEKTIKYSDCNQIPIDSEMEAFISNKISSFKTHKTVRLFNSGRRRELHRYFGGEIRIKHTSLRRLLSQYNSYTHGYYRTNHLLHYYQKKAIIPNLTINYIYFALHYQPEYTSSPSGGIFANQLLAIKMISKALPDGWKIYVKEHPEQTCFGREKEYYDRLLRIPKTHLISLKVSSDVLIKNAKAVASLTGTVFLESAIVSVPCLCFGYTPVVFMKGVYNVSTYAGLLRTINKIESGINDVPDMRSLRAFLHVKLELCSVIGDKRRDSRFIDCINKQLAEFNNGSE